MRGENLTDVQRIEMAQLEKEKAYLGAQVASLT